MNKKQTKKYLNEMEQLETEDWARDQERKLREPSPEAKKLLKKVKSK